MQVADVSPEIRFHRESKEATWLFASIRLLVVMDELMLRQRSGLGKTLEADRTKKIIGG